MLGHDSCGVGFVCNISGEKSHEIVRLGLRALSRLMHRGAIGPDGKTGDGSGISLQLPVEFFLSYLESLGIDIEPQNLAVGSLFLYEDVRPQIELAFQKAGFKVLSWREVPVDKSVAGQWAIRSMPKIFHLILDTEQISPERRAVELYITRKLIEKDRKLRDKVYFASLSDKILVYKGMLLANSLASFYIDLEDERIMSWFCIFHQRYSTNTFPDWKLAQPFRHIAHNGEINTLQGNRNWYKNIQNELYSEVFGDRIKDILPIVKDDESDSASLDAVFELLLLSGYKPEHAINALIPPAFETNPDMPKQVRDFFEYHSLLIKPWDGPASVVFSDAKCVGAHLDRNGLRPARYTLTKDGLFVLGSESGMLELKDREILKRGRLGPGDTILVDPSRGVLETSEILLSISELEPYGQWLENNLIRLSEIRKENTSIDVSQDLTSKLIAFGYTQEEIKNQIAPSAKEGKEITFSMGDDTPLPPLSLKPQLLFRYFKQRFAQVTNPPIDPIRERSVMSLKMNLGHKRNFLVQTPEHAKRLQINSPVLLPSDIEAILSQSQIKAVWIPMTYPKERAYLISELQDLAGERRITDILYDAMYEGASICDLRLGAEVVSRRVEEAVKEGANIVILSDRNISRYRVAVPSLLAISSCFAWLSQKGLASKVSIILETGEARDSHHIACLIGYGASAVYPYLAYELIKDLCEKGEINLELEKAIRNYKKALEDGLLKIISKMGISTINSYHGAKIFDAICLSEDFINEFFPSTAFTMPADSIFEIQDSLIIRHDLGFEETQPKLDQGGDMKFRKGQEAHAWSPHVVRALHKFLQTKNYEDYLEFSKVANEEHPVFLRHLLEPKFASEPLPLEEVEPEEEILKRFVTGGMSLGALSPEAHELLALACNALGMRSNSGEGGEDPARYFSNKNSAIKQVASGRFGVTPTYLASAKEIEIKIAQGAKPGEGGQLPGKKVNSYIAKLRYAQEGVSLISPPPHHDIYSIEDLAQLINDLKEANPKARVCVKLVSETGVGTVSAGVAKAYADIIQISSAEGGTGASPYTSIKNAGNYWEVGLYEAHKTLVENSLREKVRLRVDGALRTAKDVIIAALLGAEEFGFGTVAMIAEGCVMARVCHTNQCPTGVATQDEKYRAKFRGSFDDLVAYFKALAHEVRVYLSKMGFRSLSEIIGRADLIELKSLDHIPGSRRFKLETLKFKNLHQSCKADRNDNPSRSALCKTLEEEVTPYIKSRQRFKKTYEISNIDRSVPTRLSYHISMLYGDTGLDEDTIDLTFVGTAGQSFGAFNHKGMTLTLIGDANDYVGKGMHGGKIIIKPQDLKEPHKNVSIGNTCLYGATGGELYCLGKSGERFAVRNSGAIAIVEGAGMHCCEYMTGGIVVVLGEVGQNFGAGMTGGEAFVLDSDIDKKLNKEYVIAIELSSEDEERLKALIENHYKYTNSPLAAQILENFGIFVKRFYKIMPLEQLKLKGIQCQLQAGR
ncbi:MAG: glutamate synthase large subunit [Aquificaceae bacterium]